MQAELDNGASVRALRRFNDNLRCLPAQGWGAPRAPRRWRRSLPQPCMPAHAAAVPASTREQ